jgi:hypothetical protein
MAALDRSPTDAQLRRLAGVDRDQRYVSWPAAACRALLPLVRSCGILPILARVR